MCCAKCEHHGQVMPLFQYYLHVLASYIPTETAVNKMAKETQYSAAVLPMGTHTEALVLRLPMQCSPLDSQGCWPLTANAAILGTHTEALVFRLPRQCSPLRPTGVLSLDCQGSGVPWTYRGAGP